MRAEVPALLSHHFSVLVAGLPRSPRAGRVQRMAQPEKQHFSCREQSLSWVQESISVHGSDGCFGLTFGHSPGLSGRGRKRQQEEGPPRIAGTSFSTASGCPDDCTRGSECLPYGSAVPGALRISDGITVLATISSPGSGAEHTLPHLLLLQHFSAPGHCQSAVQVVPHGASGASSASGQMPGFSGDRRQRGWECRQQQRVFPTQSQSPGSRESPLPASGTLGWGQADIVTAAEAALLPAGTLSIVPAPGSAVVTGEQPGTDWAESILPCRYGVGWLQCHCLETQPWGPGHVGLSNLWGGSQPPHLGCLPHSACCTAGDSTHRMAGSPGP